jgi:hypothetical protein
MDPNVKFIFCPAFGWFGGEKKPIGGAFFKKACLEKIGSGPNRTGAGFSRRARLSASAGGKAVFARAGFFVPYLARWGENPIGP